MWEKEKHRVCGPLPLLFLQQRIPRWKEFPDPHENSHIGTPLPLRQMWTGFLRFDTFATPRGPLLRHDREDTRAPMPRLWQSSLKCQKCKRAREAGARTNHQDSPTVLINEVHWGGRWSRLCLPRMWKSLYHKEKFCKAHETNPHVVCNIPFVHGVPHLLSGF